MELSTVRTVAPVTSRSETLVREHPIASLSLAVGAGVVASQLVGARRLWWLVELSGLAAAAKRFSPVLGRLGADVLGVAVHSIADEVVRVRPALSEQVRQIEQDFIARLDEAEKSWRP